MKRIIRLLKRNKLHGYPVVVTLLFVMAGVVHATDDQPVPNTFYSGDLASSSEVNANFDWLVERSWDFDNASGTDIYYNVSGGNVGIGTDQPDFKLDVDGGSGTAIHAQSSGGYTIEATSTAGGGYAAIHAFTDTADTYAIWASSADYVGGRFESNSGTALEAQTDTGYAGIFMGGNVGIGTSSPGSMLQIEDDTSGELALMIHNRDNEGSERLYFGTSSGSDAGITVWGSSNTAYMGKWRFFNNKTSGNYDWVTSGSIKMTLANNGNLGIGTPIPSVALDVIGSIEYTGTITDVSDERLKENIHPIDGALEKVQAITGVYFNMIDTPEQTELGVIAQDVQKVLPEAVKVVDEENGYLGVSYTSLVPVLIEAVKALKEKNEALEIENKALKQDVQQIKTALGL